MFFLLACGSVVNVEQSFVEFQHGLREYVSCFVYVVYTVLLTRLPNRLGIENTLAFDAERLSAVNSVDVLMKVIKHSIIHGYQFYDALEHALNQGVFLGRHTNVIHITPRTITRYMWAHKTYQPWGHRSPVQCRQCGILKPWFITFVHTPQGEGYKLECRNPKCGRVPGEEPKEPLSFLAIQPPKSRLLRTAKDSEGVTCGWLRLKPVDIEQ